MITTRETMASGRRRHVLEFNSTLLKGALKSIEPQAPHADHVERRQARSAVIGQATIIPLTKRLPASPMPVLVRDLSPSGVCIILSQSFHIADRFLLLLPVSAGLQRAVLSEVKHWRPLSEGLLAVGAQFLRMIETVHGVTGAIADEPSSLAPGQATPVQLPVAETIGQFQESAWRGMKPAELAQLRELEARLASLLQS
jgi:hypothetical protein